MLDGEKKGFSEHKVMLCLDKELYRAFIKLQADKELGRSYAGLLPYVEGLFHMGYITQEVRDSHVLKYSQPLIQIETSSCGVANCHNEAVGFAVYKPRKTKYALCEMHLAEAKIQRNLWDI